MKSNESYVKYGCLVRHYYKHKKGIPILFIHGMCGYPEDSGYMKNYIRMFVNKGWYAVNITLPGHFDYMGCEFGKLSVLDYADSVRKVVEEIGPCVLVGHSMGGLIAQKVCENNKLVRAAVFMTSAPPKGISVQSLSLAWRLLKMRYIFPILFSKPLVLTYSDAKFLVFNNLAEKKKEKIYELSRPESGKATKEMSFGLMPVDETKIKCPTLVVGAGLDRITPARIQKKIADKYKSDYLFYDNRAHMLMLEKGWQIPALEVFAWIKSRINQ